MNSGLKLRPSQERIIIGRGTASIDGDLTVPPNARAVIVFAHGSGSGRHSPRNRLVAGVLNRANYATLLMDLLTADEEATDATTGSLRFNVEMLARRLSDAADWVATQKNLRHLSIGYFGASTGAAAALIASARHPDHIFAIVSRGGRPDLAGAALGEVKAPTLLVVGENDPIVLDLNRRAACMMHGKVRIEIVPQATHLFEEPGTLEIVAILAQRWFNDHLRARTQNAIGKDLS